MPYLPVCLAPRTAAPDGTDGSGRWASAGQHADTGATTEGGADAYARATEPTRREETTHGMHLSQLQRCRQKVQQTLITFTKADQIAFFSLIYVLAFVKDNSSAFK